MERRHQNTKDRDVTADADRKHDELEVRPRWPGKRSLTEAQPPADPRASDMKRIRAAITSLRGGGTPLPGAMTAEYSKLLGLDLSDVRIHHGGSAGAAARKLEATAFTHGSDIAVADHLDLDSAFGRHVIAHELVHVAQNKRNGGADLAAHMDVGPSGTAIEQEAERGAAALTRGMSFVVGTHSRLPGISRFGGDETPPTGGASPVPVPGTNPPPVDSPVRAQVPTPTSQPTQAQPAVTPAAPVTPTAQPTPQARPTDQPGAQLAAPATPTAGTPGHNAPSGSGAAPNPTTPANREGRPVPSPRPQPAAAVQGLDQRVQAELENRADPTAKAGYARAIAGVDALRIQALQFSFTPSGVWNTLVETFTAKNAFQDHFGQIYTTNAYRGGTSWVDTAQSWIEGLRGVVHIIGDVASVVSAWAGLAALVTGALALIFSETVIGGIALGAIAVIAAEVAMVAGAIKLMTDVIDMLLGIIQMIILVVRARNSKDPAARARFAALLRKEAGDFGSNVVSIGMQVAVMAVSAGIGAGISRGANGFLATFRAEFSRMIAPALKPWTLGQNFSRIAMLASPAQAGRGVSTNVTGRNLRGQTVPRTALNAETEAGIIGIQRNVRGARGRMTTAKEIVPFTGANQMRGARLILVRRALVSNLVINTGGFKIGTLGGQTQADIKQPRADRGGTSSSSPSANGGRVDVPREAGSDLSKVSMWPSQIEAFESSKGPLQGAADRTQRQYEMAESQAGPELAAQVRTAFQGATNNAGQMRFGAMQVQTDAQAGQANTQRGLAQTGQAQQQTGQLGAQQTAANRSVTRIGNEGPKLQSPPPKEGVLGWLYNQTIGRIGSWIGSAQRWVTNLVGKWAMSLGGFSKEEMDIAGIENDLREDDKKDQTSTQEAQDTALRADAIQQTVFQLQADKTRDEQYAIQSMADAQRFIQALEDADRQLAAAIQNGQAYIGQVTPLIAHEMQTEETQASIDAAYLLPVTSAVTAFTGSLDDASVSAGARQEGNAALNQMKATFPELDISQGQTAIGTAVTQYDTALGQLVGNARTQAGALSTALQAFIGTQDYDGVSANAAALEQISSDFDRQARSLGDQLYTAIQSVVNQYTQHIQNAIDQAMQIPDDPDAPTDAAPAADPPAATPAPAVQRKAIPSSPVIAVQRKVLTNAAAPQQMPQSAPGEQQAVPRDINNPAPAAAPTPTPAADNANTTPQPAGDAATATGAQVPGAPNNAPNTGLIGGASNTTEGPATATKAKPANATPKQMAKPEGPDKAEGETENEAENSIVSASAGTGAGSNGADNASEPGAASDRPKPTRTDQPATDTEAASTTTTTTTSTTNATPAKKPDAKAENSDARGLESVGAGGEGDAGGGMHSMVSGSTIEDGWSEQDQKEQGGVETRVPETEEVSTESNDSSNMASSNTGSNESSNESSESEDDGNDAAFDAVEQAPEPETAGSNIAVQRRSTGPAATSSPVEVATQATAGGGSALPYLDTIQSSFGAHDVGAIRSHSGSAAEAGAEALGARAFAVGDAVAFGASPDLHTAAHEAAHVVQQRAGLRPSGGIDSGPADSLEQHADAVADAVVAGRSAQSILDQLVGGSSSGAASTGVQRKGTTPTVTSKAADVEGGAETRTTLGVGEVVTLTSSVAGTWTATGGTAAGAENTDFEWTAPGKAGQFIVRVKTKDGEATKEFAVVGPSKMTFKATETYGPSRANMLGAGMAVEMTVGAANVSFKNITIREQAGGASGTSGYFAGVAKSGREDLNHYPTGKDDKGKANAPKQTNVKSTNVADRVDDASMLDVESQPWSRPFSVGSMTWQIPYLYSCGEVTDQSFTIITQTMSIVDSKGTVTVTKGSASTSRTPTQPLWQPPPKPAAEKQSTGTSTNTTAPTAKAGAGATGYAVGNADGGYAVGEGSAPAPSAETKPDAAKPDGAEVKTKVASPAMEAGDDRKTVGVGEVVTFTSTANGAWTATAVGGKAKTSGKGKKYKWTAPATATTATITFEQEGKKTPTEIKVIAPTGVDFWKRSEQTFAAGAQGAGMYTGVKFLPFTVSFVHTSWKEVAGPPSNMKGYFTSTTPPSHKPNANWLHIDDANGGPTDHAAYWGVKGNPGWSTGSFDWAIPNRYQVDGESGAGYEFAMVTQSMSIDDVAGTTTVTKAGPNSSQTATVTRKVPPAPVKKGKGKSKGKGKGEATGRGAETPKERQTPQEKRGEQSDNATYAAMDSKLKLLAYELHAAGKKLSFDLALASADKKTDKASFEAHDAQLMSTIHPLDGMAYDIAGQFRTLNTPKSEPRLEEGAQALMAALAEFEPVRTQVDTYMTTHKAMTPSWEVVGRSEGIIAKVFPGVNPGAKPLTSVEQSSGFMRDSSINAHLDAAIVAAQNCAAGDAILYSDRVILHAKELADLLKSHPRVEGQLEAHIKKLVGLVDKVLVNDPWLARSFNEAIDPIRNVK